MAEELRASGKTWRQCAISIWCKTGEMFQPQSVKKAVGGARAEAAEAMREQAAAMVSTS
jgi:hypothetical protein